VLLDVRHHGQHWGNPCFLWLHNLKGKEPPEAVRKSKKFESFDNDSPPNVGYRDFVSGKVFSLSLGFFSASQGPYAKVQPLTEVNCLSSEAEFLRLRYSGGA